MKLPPNICVTKVTDTESNTAMYSISFSMGVGVRLNEEDATTEYINWVIEKAANKLIDDIQKAVGKSDGS
jgi:hypothetical protein